MRTALRAVILALVLGGIALGLGLRHRSTAPTAARTADAVARARAAGQMLNAPLVFEPNRGQADASIRYLSRGPGYELGLDSRGASLSLRASAESAAHDTVRLTLNGASHAGALVPEQRTTATVSYFKGRDQNEWLHGLPTYDRVRYASVYPGVDLVFYGNQQQFEYDFQVAAGADPHAIHVGFSGADRVELDASGDLVLHVGDGEIRQRRPILYQEIGGKRRAVDGRYRLAANNDVTFDVGAYDAREPLVIDPLIAWGTYVANTAAYDNIGGVALTSKGEVIIAAAEQWSPVTLNGNMTVTKLDANGALLNRTTLLSTGNAAGVAVDYKDNVYVGGQTSDLNFPSTSNALIQQHPVLEFLGFIPTSASGANYGFVAKFSPDLSTLLYASYLGGDGDIAQIEVDFQHPNFPVKINWTINPGNAAMTALSVRPGTEEVYLAGWDESGMFPMTSTAMENYVPATVVPSGLGSSSHRAGVALAIDTTRSGVDSLQYSTYLASGCADQANAIVVDALGHPIVTGQTAATNADWLSTALCGSFPVTDGAALNSGNGWVMKLPAPESANANDLVWGTYLSGQGIAVGLHSQDGGADVVESNNNTLTFTRVGYGLKYDIPITDLPPGSDAFTSIDYQQVLGTGSHAAISTVIMGGQVYPPVSQIVVYDYDATYTDILQIHMSDNGSEDVTMLPGTAGAVVANTSTIIAGINTGVHTLATDGTAGVGQINGFVASLNHLNDPNQEGADVIIVQPDSYQHVVPATSAAGAVVTYSMNAVWLKENTTLTPTCNMPSGSVFPIGATYVQCSASAYSGEIGYGWTAVIVTDIPRLTPLPALSIQATSPAGAIARYGTVASDMLSGTVAVSCSQPSGSTFPFGTTTVTCQASDPLEPASLFSPAFAGPWVRSMTAVTSFTVTVADNVPPVLTIVGQGGPGDNLLNSSRTLAPNGTGGATYGFTATATDNVDGSVPVACAGNGQTATTYPAVFTFAVGTGSQITCTAKDAHGNVSTASFSITVGQDSTGPVISGTPPPSHIQGVPGDYTNSQISLADQGGMALYLSSSSDACNAFGVQYDNQYPNYPLPPTCLAITANDAFDGPMPVSCTTIGQSPDNAITLGVTPQALHFSSNATWLLQNIVFNPNVSCTSTDLSGNTSTSQFTVAFQDDRGPIFANVPADIWTSVSGGNTTVSVSWTPITATDPATGAPLQVLCDGYPNSRGTFPIGDNIVTCTAPGPRMGQVNFTVHVAPGPPEFQMYAWLTWTPDLAVIASTDGNTYYYETSSTSASFGFASCVQDANAGACTDQPVTTVCSLDSAPATPCQSPIAFANLAAGAHTFTVNPQGSAAYGGGDGFAWLVLPTNYAPTLTLPNITLEATGLHGAPATYSFSASDLIDGTDSVTCDLASGLIFPPGSTIVTCSSTDSIGDAVTGQFTVTVLDTTPPVIAPLPNISVTATGPLTPETVPAPAPAADLLDGTDAVVCGLPNGSLFPIGVTTVACESTDQHGNMATAGFTVTVTDTLPPSVSVPGNMIVPASAPNGSIVNFSASASDPVYGGVPVTCAPASGSRFPIGTTTVACSAVNASGRSASASFTVTVSINVTLTSSMNPSTLGRPVTLTATSDNVSAAGLVSFRDGVAPLGDAPLVNGQATLTTSLLGAGSHTLSAFFGSVSGSLTQTVNSLTQTGFVMTGSYPINYDTLDVPAIGDFNGDGVPDIAVADFDSSVVQILIGKGDGSFADPVAYAAGANPTDLAIGDVNGDGLADVMSLNLSDGTVSVLLGRGDGTFMPQPATAIGGNQLHALVVADFDGDGILDAAVSSGGQSDQGRIFVLLGKGDGTFKNPVAYAVGKQPGYLTIGDFNGDGIVDLAVSNSGDNTVGVMLGKGDGTFAVPANFTFANNAPRGLAAADLNGDGITDIAVLLANGSLGKVAFLAGKGDGTFTLAATLSAGQAASRVLAGDINGDGHADLVMAGGINGTLTTIAGHGDGTFDAVVTYPANDATFAVAMGDLNRDGRVDLAITTEGDGLAIWLGTPLPAALSIAAPPAVSVNATGASGAAIDDAVLGAATTSGGVAPINITRAPAGNQFAVGSTTVIWMAADADGNSAMAQQQVTVNDVTPPVVTVPADITLAAASANGAVVTFTASATDIVDGSVLVSCVPASGSTFAVGATPVVCSSTDAHGNSASAGFTVTVTPYVNPVKNAKPPKVTAPKNMKVEATGPAGAIVTFTATATDPVDGTLPVTCAPASGTMFPLGATTVTCSATNSAAKSATDTAVITVRDTTAPVIVSVTPSASVLPNTDQIVPVTIAAVATDLVDPAPACAITKVAAGSTDLNDDGISDWTITGPLSLNIEAVARKNKDRTYTITVKCTDASGNASKEKIAVVVSYAQ
jgi:hypothetical protein